MIKYNNNKSGSDLNRFLYFNCIMIRFETTLQQFSEKGEKSGWTYIQIPQDLAHSLIPNQRKSFRVKGHLDAFPIKSVAVMPMGDGSFILPVNATMRKGIHKKKGAMVSVSLSVDKATPEIPPAFADCLADEPVAKAFFEQLPLSHRNYYCKWVTAVKSEILQANRMAQVLDALLLNQNFGTFMQSLKAMKKR